MKNNALAIAAMVSWLALQSVASAITDGDITHDFQAATLTLGADLDMHGNNIFFGSWGNDTSHFGLQISYLDSAETTSWIQFTTNRSDTAWLFQRYTSTEGIATSPALLLDSANILSLFSIASTPTSTIVFNPGNDTNVSPSITINGSPVLTSAGAAVTYLTQADANQTYLTPGTANSTYLTQWDAYYNYLTPWQADNTYYRRDSYSFASASSGAYGYSSTALGNSWAGNSYSTALGTSSASGYASSAMGGSYADAEYSTAMGNSIANGNRSTAMGCSYANGDSSTAMGTSTANGYFSTAMGYSSTANGGASTAMGSSWANGDFSTAMGLSSTAIGNSSTAMGSSWAGGVYSTAMGYSSTANGDSSTAMGSFSVAQSLSHFVTGQYNIVQQDGNPNTWVPTDELFTIGNGTDDSNRSNALVLLKNGKLTLPGPILNPNNSPTGITLDPGDGNPGTASIQIDGQILLTTGYAGQPFLTQSAADNTYFRRDSSSFATSSSTANGAYSTALGSWSTANGYASTALGYYSNANGFASIAMGVSSANYDYATAMGMSSANGYVSTAMGYSSATGDFSTSSGRQTVAQSFAQFVIGQYNLVQQDGSPYSWVPTDELFTIGNGTDESNRSNALVVKKNGDIGIGTSYPACKLDVSGDINFSGNILHNGWPVSLGEITYTANGNVATRFDNLNVSGDTIVSGNLSVNGTFLVPERGDLSMGEFQSGPQPQ